MRTKFHIHFDIRQFLSKPDSELRGVFQNAQTGAALTPDEARDFLIGEVRKGYSKTSLCDSRKPDGSCAGHPVPEGGAE